MSASYCRCESNEIATHHAWHKGDVTAVVTVYSLHLCRSSSRVSPGPASPGRYIYGSRTKYCCCMCSAHGTARTFRGQQLGNNGGSFLTYFFSSSQLLYSSFFSLSLLPDSRNSDPGSHSMIGSPPPPLPTTVPALEGIVIAKIL